MLSTLKQKRLLVYENNQFHLFSLSFRYFLLFKKETTEIKDLKSEYAVSGKQENLRVPILVLIAVAGIFYFYFSG